MAILAAWIIPARAGFTRRRRWWRPWPGDHPRSRGVYAKTLRGAQALLGSSPLARGLQLWINATTSRPGIIPARAGFTSPSIPLSSPPWDHPRSRGVYKRCDRRSSGRCGSSPLARGLRDGAVVLGSGAGIIPARAGFTVVAAILFGLAWDHPRSRGVYNESGGAVAGQEGSSPLARGLHLAELDAQSRGRIIPARAGFTHPTSNDSSKDPDHPRSRGVYSMAWQAM